MARSENKEVLVALRSSRSSRARRNRASRWFLVALVVVIAAGVTVYVRNFRPHAAQAKADPRPAAPAPAQPPAIDPTVSRALLPQQPNTKPADGKDAPKPPAKPADAPKPAPPPPAPSGPVAPAAAVQKVLADAKAKSDAKDLVGARTVLNAALNGTNFAEPDAAALRRAIAELNAKLIFSREQFADPHIDLVQVESSRTLTAAARSHAVPWEGVCRVTGVSDRKIKVGMKLKVPHGPFHAVVDKSDFRLDLYLGGLPGEANALYVTSLPVGLGKDDSTPTGLWTVTAGSKGKNLDWTNPRTNEHFAGDDPKNPLAGFWIGLTGEGGNAVGKQSYGIHGTIEPETVGKQASMGCIRLRHDDIALVYDLLSEGKSRVMVKD
jgi:lipoprotein-anchoring transpeptidase ErfK/SrfK